MPSDISGITSSRRKQGRVNKSLLGFLPLLLIGFILGWFVKPQKELPKVIEKGRDTVIVQDTIKLPGKPISVFREDTVTAKRDSDNVTYTDSIQGESENGSYKITHSLMINPDSLDKAISNWDVEIKPVEKLVTKSITETVYKDVVQEVDTPYYRNVWFYVSSILTLLLIILGLR